ncbi:monosaccharide ABC transporter ATP-binding protein (CUT2 family) [Hydrogenispora ethanolica]|uniref:Monosaccharide ABC transporter ATP-binding protein (CUT2 family) n=1 Tax=Hydrogenispora ethanolica TaxID=1082276 RepID=A0A4R1RAG9_HYDET|nr:sugar ABC transporter ATP-binding protein [Hydrogenispora ethanolica]TCL62753.1 monosaccharide ABC transporter ATP-binding protein (CUT2 family) [Hydrogenispora ethanolica]
METAVQETPVLPVLATHQITKRYGATIALRNVDFQVHAGEIHALVGENGAGKSTLIKILAGAVRKDSGEIRLDGKKIELQEPAAAQRLGIRVVYQDFSLFPNITVGENLLVGRWHSRLPGLVDWKACYRRAEELLQGIGFQLDVRKPLNSLGVAEKQMLEIAKAVAEQPRLLILDEPTAVLEEEETQRLFGVVRRLRQSGTGIIFISHHLEEIFTLADRVTILKDGQVVDTRPTASTTKDELIQLMVGRELGDLYPKRIRQRGRPILEVRDLAGENRIHHVNFTLHEGEILGFAGLVGSGRTEVARCVFGADRTSAGSMMLDGKPVSFRSPREAIAAGLAFLTEDRKKDGLFPDVSIEHNVSAASLSQFSKLAVLSESREAAAVNRVIQKLAVKPNEPRKLVKQLSGGNQQKVALAKWLLTESKVIILDQPTWGVDVGTMVEIYHFVAELAARGKAVMLISSVLPEILGLSDRIIVMREGATVAEFDRPEATEEKILAHAMGVSE